MNKFGVVLGVAAVVTLAGCKDPDYKTGSGSQNEVKTVEKAPEAQTPAVANPEPQPQPVQAEPAVKHCTCAPGTKHDKPCACGADDCQCIVEVKSVSAKPAPEPEYTVYVVQNGDYLAKISKKFNVTIASVKSLNNLKSDMIRVGQKLKLPGKIDVSAAPAAKKAPAEKKAAAKKSAYKPYAGATKEYVVKSGDTLGAIAYGNGLNIRQLKELNGLTKDTLKVGQKLKIPADAKAAKAAKAAPAAKAKPVAKPAVKDEPKTETAKEQPAVALEQVNDATEPSAALPAETKEETPANADVEQAMSQVSEVPVPETTEYVVQEGEDITGVAIKWGLSSSDIRELNSLGEKDELRAGQKIKIPASAVQQ